MGMLEKVGVLFTPDKRNSHGYIPCEFISKPPLLYGKL